MTMLISDLRKKRTLFQILICLYSFSFSQTGPGGVGINDGTSTLNYWLSGNMGVTTNATDEVTAILDLSGYNVVNTINGAPTVEAGLLNGQDVLRFNGTNESIQTDWNIEAATYQNLTAIAVYIPAVEFSQTVWGAHSGGYEGRYLTDNNIAAPSTTNFVGPGYNPNPLPHGASQITGLFPTGSPVIASVVIREDAVDGSDVRINGALASSFTSDHSDDSFEDLAVANASGSDFWFNGDIAEIVFFGEALTDLQLNIIENYLSAKYGIPLATNDLYTGDDSGYDFDVAGIGRISAMDLHTNSRGTGIVTINNPTDLDDSEYLFFGHDNNSLSFSETSDVPSGVQSRLSRIWRASEIGEVGDIDLTWNLADIGTFNTGQLVLLIDTDNDGFFDDETTITGPTNLGTDNFLFAEVNLLNNDSRFTIAILDNPLPVELVSFRAHQIEQNIHLQWQTSSELHNDYFSIERSSDSEVWETIGIVPGNGTTNESTVYKYLDLHPLATTSFYRLKQTDFDGAFEYSSTIVSEYIDSNFFNITLSPNPANTFLQITGVEKLDLIAIYDLNGRNFSTPWTLQNGIATLTLDSIPTGTYIVKISRGKHFSSHEIVIK